MFEYASPRSIGDAVALLREIPGARLLNGGTDLLVGVRKGTLRPPLIVDLKRAADLPSGVEQRDRSLVVGATTPLSQMVGDARIREHFPALVDAAQVVGSIQIRNRATLAGNVCNASPAADTATPLLIHGAIVVMVGPTGTRRVALDEFFVGPGRTVIGQGEVVTAIELPLPAEPRGTAFARMTRRRGVDLATVNLCCSVSSDGVTSFGFGAVGPRPILVSDRTGVLADAETDPLTRDRVLRELTAAATPISNVRASREYREQMLFVLSRRALEAARSMLARGRHAR